MKPKESEKAFAKRIGAGGKALADLTAAEGVEAMLAFYAEERAEGCNLNRDGDMLLYQWGTHDFGKAGKSFQLDVTRQFILPRQDEPFQLSLTFHFAATPKLAKLKSGSKWCPLPDRADAFRESLLASPAYRAVSNESAKKVELDFSQC